MRCLLDRFARLGQDFVIDAALAHAIESREPIGSSRWFGAVSTDVAFRCLA